MNVRMPPRFGVWAVAGAAMVAIQRTAPRPAAATPDFLIMTFLLLLEGGSVHQSSGHLRRSVRRCWARKRSRSMNLTHLAAGHPVAGTHLSEVRTDPAAAGDRDRATRMKHAARRRIDRARLTGLNLRPASTLGSGAGTASRRARV